MLSETELKRRLRGKTIGITGIGGFIGTHLAARCEKLGARIVGLERNGAAARAAEGNKRRILLGDVTDRAAVADMCHGCDFVVHTAAIVAEAGSWKTFRQINVQGARLVAEVASVSGVKVFAHLSSVMVYGFRFPPRVTEAGPFDGAGSPYCQTKIESERAVLELDRAKKMRVVIIRPGDVYGPGSVPWVVRLLENLRRGVYAHVDGGSGLFNHIYIDNLIDGILLALMSDQAAGEAFVFTDDRRTTWRGVHWRTMRLGGAAGAKVAAGLVGAYLVVGRVAILQIAGCPAAGSPQSGQLPAAPRAVLLCQSGPGTGL